jgi:hypothetical protein
VRISGTVPERRTPKIRERVGKKFKLEDMADLLFNKVWRLNKAQTKFSSSFQPSEETRLYEEVPPKGYKLTVKGINKGEPYEWGYTAQYDGKNHPVYGRSDVAKIEAHRLNARQTIGFFKQSDDSEGGPYSRVVSEDGKHLTVEAAGRRQDGTPFYDVLKYDS